MQKKNSHVKESLGIIRANSSRGMAVVQWFNKLSPDLKALTLKIVEISFIVMVILMVQKVLLLTSEQHGINWKEILKDPQTWLLGIQLIVIGAQAWIMRRQAKTAERANEISREVAYMPIQKEILFNWVKESNNLLSLIKSVERLILIEDTDPENPKLKDYLIEEIEKNGFLYNDFGNRMESYSKIAIYSLDMSLSNVGKIKAKLETWIDFGKNNKKIIKFFSNIDYKNIIKLSSASMDKGSYFCQTASSLTVEIEQSQEAIINFLTSKD